MGVEVEDLRIVDATGTSIVANVAFTIRSGECMGLVGESGSGKSITSLAILGLLPDGLGVASGRVTVAGKPLPLHDKRAVRLARGRQVSMIFQDPLNSLNPVFTVKEQMLYALRVHIPTRAEALGRAHELLSRVGITDTDGLLRKYPHQISGGQAQRVSIAMAVAGKPDLLIADEPTTALDVTVQAGIISLLIELKQMGQTILFISHDLAVVSQVSDSVSVMQHGHIVESGAAARVFDAAQHPYTKRLLETARALSV
jgi:ABC-type dipeptide/oligopeptide/nickel transport system ATPase component